MVVVIFKMMIYLDLIKLFLFSFIKFSVSHRQSALAIIILRRTCLFIKRQGLTPTIEMVVSAQRLDGIM